MSAARALIRRRCWARLARSVIALEEEEALVRLARENLKAVGTDNVTVTAGPLTRRDLGRAVAEDDVVRGSVLPALPSPGPWARPRTRRTGRLFEPAAQLLYRSLPLFAGDASGWLIFDAAAPVLPGFAAPPEFVF